MFWQRTWWTPRKPEISLERTAVTVWTSGSFTWWTQACHSLWQYMDIFTASQSHIRKYGTISVIWWMCNTLLSASGEAFRVQICVVRCLPGNVTDIWPCVPDKILPLNIGFHKTSAANAEIWDEHDTGHHFEKMSLKTFLPFFATCCENWKNCPYVLFATVGGVHIDDSGYWIL